MSADSDMGAMWREHKERQQAKRASNREKSSALLVKAGIYFTSHNMGAHLIVAERFNFWPGTGLWMECRKPKREGRGVHRLINLLKESDGNASL